MVRIGCTLAQLNPVMGDLKGNAQKIIDAIRSVKQSGGSLAVFPEMALCGYPPEDLLHHPSFLLANRHYLEKIADAASGLCAVVGFAASKEGNIFNAAAVIHDREIKGIYHKIELPNYGVFDEKRYFMPGTQPLVIGIQGARLMVTICEDIWIRGGIVERQAVAMGADVILNLSASPFHSGKLQAKRDMIAGLAQRTNAAVVYVNMTGGQDELVFDGGSMVFDARGRVIASAPRFVECLQYAEVAVEGNPATAAANDALLALDGLQPGERSGEPNHLAGELTRIEEIEAALVMGTRDYVVKNGFTKVVLGLSGGIDSALTAAIAQKALGAENVVGVTMPSVYSSEATKSDAALVAERLGIRLLTLPIQQVMERYQETLAPVFAGEEAGLAHENLQARIRGNLLMALSNRFGWLVLTTGNKSETAVGYCTLYGDMAGGFAVIKDLTKQDVYRLARHINAQAGEELIPQSTIDRAPTAELRPNQKDEDSLPPYDVLDDIVRGYVEGDLPPDQIIAGGKAAEVVWKTIRMIDHSEYKRRQAAPGVKITPKAFGRDRRIPITNRFNPSEPLD